MASTAAIVSGESVVIAGGGVVGSAVAYFVARALRERGSQLQGAGAAARSGSGSSAGWRVTVVERDPTYRFASSALSASSIRHQFSTPENVLIGQYLPFSLFIYCVIYIYYFFI